MGRPTGNAARKAAAASLCALFVSLFLCDDAHADITFSKNSTPQDQAAFKNILAACKEQSKSFKDWMEKGKGSIENDSKAHVVIDLVHDQPILDAWGGNEGHTTNITVNLDNLGRLPQLTKNDKGKFVMPEGEAQWALTQCDLVAHFLAEAWITAKTGGKIGELPVTAHQKAITSLQNAVRKDLGLPEILSQTNYSPASPDNYNPYSYRDKNGKPVKVDKIFYLEIRTAKGYEWITFNKDEKGRIEKVFLDTAKNELKTLPGGPIGLLVLPGAPASPRTPVAPPTDGEYVSLPDWTGVSITGQAGLAVGGGQWQTGSVVSLGVTDPLVDYLKDLASTDPALAFSIGYSFQLTQSLLWGIEVEIDYAFISMDPGIPGTGAIGTAAVRANDSVVVKMRGGGSVLARFGYLVDPETLVYATGGPSWQHVSATVNCSAAGVCGTNGIPAFSQTNSDILNGWTAGFGIERRFSGNLRGRLEYRYSAYNSFVTTFGTPANLQVGSTIDVHKSAVMMGLSYVFRAR